MVYIGGWNHCRVGLVVFKSKSMQYPDSLAGKSQHFLAKAGAFSVTFYSVDFINTFDVSQEYGVA
jgi:hypothetical protein